MTVIRVYADGVFDLFHHGHGGVLEQAKHLFDDVHLIAGLHSDATVHAMKGPTVMSFGERVSAMRHCKWVDEIVEDAPWQIDEAFIKEHDIDFVAHDGAPYPSPGLTDLYEIPKRLGIFVSTERSKNISTSDLVQRILDNFDMYTERNAKRK